MTCRAPQWRPTIQQSLAVLFKTSRRRFHLLQSQQCCRSLLRREGPKKPSLRQCRQLAQDATSNGWTAEGIIAAWPRMPSQPGAMTVRQFGEMYGRPGCEFDGAVLTLRGRVSRIRKMGSSIVFVDINQNGHNVQLMFKINDILDEKERERFRETMSGIHRSDFISATGSAGRSSSGELSLMATALPTVLSRAVRQFPLEDLNEATRYGNRHLEFHYNNQARDRILLRAHLIGFLQDYLTKESFVSVQTPVIADRAGGAIARPFTTRAFEFFQKTLALRVAPELWLKRLVLAGFDNVFEIGPSFRNEGIDSLHNPEFWSCEFYEAYANLESLLGRTERMLGLLSQSLSDRVNAELKSLKGTVKTIGGGPYKRIEFIPALERIFKSTFPNLNDSAESLPWLISLFEQRKIPLPHPVTVLRLLDRLAEGHLLSSSKEPTWLMHPPECMSPLAKSFEDPTTKQRVAASAELYIDGEEYINTYEEENSPVEQLRKFRAQAAFKKKQKERTGS